MESRNFTGSETTSYANIIFFFLYDPIVRPNEGDAYPLGALPVGTRIHCLEKNPGQMCHLIHAAGTFGTILRKFDEKVVVQLPSKREFAFQRTCMATVGRLSNPEHNKEHVGSAQRMREMGNRPRSGLWKRKEGKHGRKIRRLPPMTTISPPAPPKEEAIKLTLPLWGFSFNFYVSHNI